MKMEVPFYPLIVIYDTDKMGSQKIKLPILEQKIIAEKNLWSFFWFVREKIQNLRRSRTADNFRFFFGGNSIQEFVKRIPKE